MNADDKAIIYQKKMEILLSLRGFTIIKINDLQALWKMNSAVSITIDVSFPSKLWEVKIKGTKIDDWKTDSGLPASTRGMIQSLEDDFIQACAAAGILVSLDGSDTVTPERLAEIKNDLTGVHDEPVKEDNNPGDVGATESPENSLPVDTPPNETHTTDPMRELIKILGALLETPTNPGFPIHEVKRPTEEVTA